MTKKAKKMRDTMVEGQEKGARKAVLEELFYDFNTSRFQIYKMNFVRGLFFGFGSVLGGTVIIALLIWILTILANHIPALSDLFQGVSATLEQSNE